MKYPWIRLDPGTDGQISNRPSKPVVQNLQYSCVHPIEKYGRTTKIPSAKTGGVLHVTCSAPPGLHTRETRKTSSLWVSPKIP